MQDLNAAKDFGPMISALVEPGSRLAFEFWDGSVVYDGAGGDAKATVIFNDPIALRRVLWAPNELGFVRAVVLGEIEIVGDIYHAISIFGKDPGGLKIGTRSLVHAVFAAKRHGILGRPLPPPPEEFSTKSKIVHSKERDVEAISHHYDVSNEFYSLILGPTMTYTCARFKTDKDSLETAQTQKHELVCRKLSLKPGMRLLDVGCGWGQMVIHAAQNFGVSAVGITISEEQAEMARKRVAEAGVADKVEIRIQDYRDINEQFDAISSVGMFEAVGKSKADGYFNVLYKNLAPSGRLLNHAISTPDGWIPPNRSFVHRYVFPDGELIDLATTQAMMQKAGFEVRDVETLREHYAKTLRFWVDNLLKHWDEAVEIVGIGRARVWWLYMTGSAVDFEINELSLHQVLAIKTPKSGDAKMALTRSNFES